MLVVGRKVNMLSKVEGEEKREELRGVKQTNKQTNRLLYYGSRKAGLKTSILKHSKTITLPNKVTLDKSLQLLRPNTIKEFLKRLVRAKILGNCLA